MIPEAILVAILIAFFIADFASEKDDSRGWFNPFACVLMGQHDSSFLYYIRIKETVSTISVFSQYRLDIILFFCKIYKDTCRICAPIAQWIEHLPSKQGI